MHPGFDLMEMLISFIVVIFSVGLSLAILCLLYKIYTKLKKFEEQLNNR